MEEVKGYGKEGIVRVSFKIKIILNTDSRA
jgi:hypothetical protein